MSLGRLLQPLFVVFFLFISFNLTAQTADWAWAGGGAFSGRGGGYTTRVSPNGNVLVAGEFEGTMDLDPSTATYNITSNGSTDIFLACYTSAGVFLWGFNMGGFSQDAAFDMGIDAQGNVFLTGYFRGTIDMDPSVNTANIYDNTTQTF